MYCTYGMIICWQNGWLHSGYEIGHLSVPDMQISSSPQKTFILSVMWIVCLRPPSCRPAVHSPLEQSSQLSFAMKKKLSASAGNLWETGRAVEGGNGENSSLSYAHMRLSKTTKEKVGWLVDCSVVINRKWTALTSPGFPCACNQEELSAQLAEMRTNMAAMEEKVKAAEGLKEELEKVKLEASVAQEKVLMPCLNFSIRTRGEWRRNLAVGERGDNCTLHYLTLHCSSDRPDCG